MKSMRFLFLTQYYPPEPGAASLRLQAMAHQLQRHGHEVEVVTAFPHHLGGLLSGIAIAARDLSPTTKIIGVQSHASPAWRAAFEAGQVVPVSYQETWAEGLLGGIGGENFALAEPLVDSIELVTEEDIKSALYWALDSHHMVLEGSAAVSLAYALYHTDDKFRGQTLVIVLTGSNIDLRRIRQLL